MPELLRLFAGMQYSRLPIYEENVDRIVGVLHLKDLIPRRSGPRARGARCHPFAS
jgi:CBS domain containing-hemolysin-like protein